jgi:cobalt-zinc-cadmium efflux system protein
MTREKLRLGFLLTLGILAVEITGALASRSLALFSDAGHVLTDAAALGLAWFAAAQAERPANARRTFGYHRVGILTALANGLTLVLIAGGIAVEAFRRFAHPAVVQPGIMVVAGAIAIGINLYIGWGLSRSAHANLNVRAAALHVLGDVGASIGVILGALAIAVTGATWIDPLVSLLIATLIALGALRLIIEAGSILLESTPRGISLPDLVRDILRVPGVHDVHDLHVWTISSGMLALSCHVVIDDLPPSDSAPILDRISDMLRRTYDITHTTIQFESGAHTSHEGFCACTPETSERLYCELRVPDSQRERAHEHEHARSEA